MSKLFEDSESDTETELRIDNSYAKNYDNWRQKEELNKLKTKYGENILEKSDSSSSSSEDDDDEDGIQITEKFERDFFKTLASLKTKDPKIYDENTKFFSQTTNNNEKKSKKDQPMYIKDYERKLLLENHGDDTEENIPPSKTLTYVEEQDQLKNSFKHVLQDSDDEDDKNDVWGGMLKSRKKTDAEIKSEEEEYKQWLLGQKEDIKDDIKNDLKPLKDYWNDPKLEDNEKFLRDYILNKRFLESEDKNYIPTYEEIIHDSDEDLSEDEKQIEKQEEFEHKYNYRFEEPDEEFIKRYPRTIEDSLRRQDNRRKVKRAELNERKQKEKHEKFEEIRQMQMLKRKEIEEKLQKLKDITGNTELNFKDEDIDGDFDPDSHDKRMQDLFSDEFYQGNEEEQKPEFPDLDEELGIENWAQYETETNTENGPHCEDEDFNMDCDYDPSTSKATDESKNKRKRKRKTKFAEAVSEPKPTFDPDDKTYQEYLDEYYKLECEDVIGDIPCRFKYRQVTPNSFGLTVEEILMANDRELNRWCSLKKAVQWRPENVEKYDVIAFQRKGQNESLKRKLLPSLFKEEESSTSIKTNSNTTETSNKHINEDAKTMIKSKRKRRKMTLESTKVDEGNIIGDTKNKETEFNTSIDAKEFNSSDILHPSESANNIHKKKKKKKNKPQSELTFSIGSASSQTNNNGNTSIDSETLSSNNLTASQEDTLHKKKKKKSETKTQLAKTSSKTNNTGNALDNIKSSKKREQKNKNCDNLIGKPKTKSSKKGKDENIGISDARIKAFGINPKKYKNKIKYGQKNT